MRRAILLALGLCGLLCWLLACQPPPGRDLAVGQTIPEFELPRLDGEMVSSSSYLGGPVVLNFWATWCGPCVKEIPTLNTLDRESSAQVVTIAIDNNADLVPPFVEKHGIGYTVLLGDEEVFGRFSGRSIPYTLVLNSSLRVVGMHRGYVSLRSLELDLLRARIQAP